MATSYVYERTVEGLVKEGEYEATIEKIEAKLLPSGKLKLAITYRIRTDVEQAYGNKVIFEDIWQERENPQFFNRKRINQLLGTQEIENGRVFDNIEAVRDFLVGKNLILHIAIVKDEYKGEDVNTVSFYRSSKHKPQTISSPQVETKKVVEVADDDIPF